VTWFRGGRAGFGRRDETRADLATHPLLWVAVLAGSYVLVSGLYLANAFNALELQTVDARFRVRGPTETSGSIVLVGVDARSLSQMNERLPIRRSHYAHLLDILRAGGAQTIVLDVTFAGPSQSAADDTLLRSSIGRNGPIVLAADDLGPDSTFAPTGTANLQGAVLASAAVDVDSDGVLRRMLFRQIDLRTIAVRAAEQVAKFPIGDADFSDNHAWIDYAGPPGYFPTYSLSDVLAGREPRGVFAGRTVFVGVTAPAAKDMFQTPISNVPMSGLEVHASALHTIVDGSALRTFPHPLGLCVIFLAVSFSAVCSLRRGSVQALVGSLGVVLLLLITAQLAFTHGWILPLTYSVLGIVVAALSSTAVESALLRRHAKRLDALVRPVAWTYFISYRRSQDSFAAAQIKQALEESLKRNAVFLDTDLSPGADWPRRLRDAVGSCNVVLVLIGPGWVTASDSSGGRRLDDPGDWVRLEVEAALERPDIKIVPVLLDGASMPGHSELPNSLQSLVDREGFRLEGGRQFLSEIGRLLDTIDRHSNIGETATDEAHPVP
jgi:CHASE2 domain-containing sensor protein